MEDDHVGEGAPAARKTAAMSLASGRKETPYLKMREAIIAGEFPPNQPMTEVALADHYQVSRTPIREALTRLEQDGLLERTDRGLVVRAHSPDELLDIYETRIALETAVARVAAERRTTHDLIQLRAFVRAAEEVDTSNATNMVVANQRFHQAVWKASRNRSLIDLLERLSMHLGRYPATTLSYPGRWQRGNEQHGQLVDAIEARDIELAAQVATQHFSESRDIRIMLWVENTSADGGDSSTPVATADGT